MSNLKICGQNWEVIKVPKNLTVANLMKCNLKSIQISL